MIVIGDVHGEYKLLMKLINILPQTKDICFVGDLIDRGPDSKKVLEFVKENNYKTVLGNHEEMSYNRQDIWGINGAMETIDSFGSLEDMEELGYFEWFKTLPLFIDYIRKDGQKFLISHSFAFYGKETSEYDILWGRYFAQNNLEDCINIFGHTPVKEAQKIHDKHWNIDTGATYGNKLSAIDLEDEQIYYVEKE